MGEAELETANMSNSSEFGNKRGRRIIGQLPDRGSD